MPFSIRPATEADQPAIGRIVAATDMFPPELLNDMMRPYLGTPESGESWLVLEEDGTVVGVTYCIPEQLTEGTYNLLLIALLPTHQGGGRGSGLLERVESDLRSAGQRLLLVETSGLPEFAATRAFYDRRGYTAEARIRDFFAAGDDKVIYTKRLG